MALQHTFQSAEADEVVPGGRVQPSHWNAEHILSGLMRANYAPTSGLPTGAGFNVRNTGGSAGLWNFLLTNIDGNFEMQRLDPSVSGGAYMATPLLIERDTGKATFEHIALPGYSNVKTTLDSYGSRITALEPRVKRMVSDDSGSFRSLGNANGTSTSSAPFVPGTWRYNQISIAADIVNGSFFMAVATAPATPSAHSMAVGLYDSDPATGRPLNLLYDLGTYDVSTISPQLKVGPTGLNIPAGEYYLVYNTAAGNSVNTGNIITVAQIGGFRVNLPASTIRGRFEATGTAVQPMPAVMPALTWTVSGTALSIPIFFRVL